MSFSEEMKARSQEAWEKNIHHPYIEELVAGTLDKEAFKFYIKQDILLEALREGTCPSIRSL
nr:hypothetical protein [Dolosigranulum pigrum]